MLFYLNFFLCQYDLNFAYCLSFFIYDSVQTTNFVYLESILAKTRPGVDCGSDHELLIAKFRLKLKKVGKTTRPFRYDLNQIPYNYIVEVRNRFKELDLIDRVSEELWTEVHDIVQEAVFKTIPKKKKCKKAEWFQKMAEEGILPNQTHSMWPPSP